MTDLEKENKELYHQLDKINYKYTQYFHQPDNLQTP